MLEPRKSKQESRMLMSKLTVSRMLVHMRKRERVNTKIQCKTLDTVSDTCTPIYFVFYKPSLFKILVL